MIAQKIGEGEENEIIEIAVICLIALSCSLLAGACEPAYQIYISEKCIAVN